MPRRLLLSSLMLSCSLASASDCDVALLDDPLDFPTLYKHRGGHSGEPFPSGTENTCNYYASKEYANPPGACCTGNFVNNVVYPMVNEIVNVNGLSEECRASVFRASCFACARDQTKYLSIDFQVDDLPNSTAQVKICRSTCHTVYEHCKNDAAFYIDGKHLISEERLCSYLDDGITSELAKKGSRIDVNVVEDEAVEQPECFLYDDLVPVVNEFRPPSLSTVKPSTHIFKIVFNERVSRKEASTPGTTESLSQSANDARLIQLVEMNVGDTAGKQKVVATIDADGKGSQSMIQIVTTKFTDDTLQIVFGGDDAADKKGCLLNSEENTKYQILVGSDILRDRSGNVFGGVVAKTWSFNSDAQSGCENTNGMTDLAVGVTSGVLVVLLLGGVVGCMCVQKRQNRQGNARQFVDLGEDVTRLDGHGPITEGTMVETADGAKMQVRLVPAYASPVDVGLGGVQEEKSSGQSSGQSMGTGQAATQPGIRIDLEGNMK